MFGHLFISVKSKDIKGIIKALQQMSETTVIKDMRALEFDIFEFVHSYSLKSLHKNEMSSVLMELKDVIVLHGIKVPSHFFLLARSMVTIEGVIHHMDPKLDLLELARPFMIKAIKKKFNPFTLAKKIFNGFYEFASYMEEFPGDLKNAIRKINNGKVMVDLTHKGIDPMVHTINRVSRQIIMALMFAGFTTGSILFIINKVGPFWWGTSMYGIIGLLIAGYLGWKILKDLRKGDHDDWKGWEGD